MKRMLTWIGAAALAWVLDTPAHELHAAGTPSLPGLDAPARVITDRWGIPHLQAANLSDLYYLWGWVTARDRLWQLIEQRAQGYGQMHRWFGNDELQGDGGAQLFQLHERSTAIWAREKLNPELRVPIERYTAGINAYLADCRAGRVAWPPELVALHERPADWKPENTEMLLLGLGVTLDLELPELAESRTLREHGAAWLAHRRRFEQRLEYATIPDAATANDDAPRAQTGAAELPPATAQLAERAAAAFPSHAEDGADRASNEMVVGAGRAARGRPLLANDPHLSLTSPGPFHLVHLSVPGVLEAAGATVPGLPAIVSGRNARCAWGVTALSADVIDVYADTLSADGKHVKGPQGWTPVIAKPFDLTFSVLGIPLPALGQMRRYTPHGPVLVWDPKHHLALAARWSAFEDERISMRRLVGVERSRTASEVAERYRTLVTPTINLAAADVDGDALYQTVGLVPRRDFTPGPGVLPDDGRHEWAGYIPADSMPAWHPPADGFAVNGNNLPFRPASGTEWPRYDWVHDRAARMSERLAGDRSVTLADLASVQNDVYSRASARQVPALLAALDDRKRTMSARAHAALDSLRAWDFVARRDRVGPTIARAWWNAYVRRDKLEGVPGLALARLTGEARDTLRTAGAIETPADAAADALATALDTLAAKLGPDVARWTWGRAHAAHFQNALATHGRGARFEPALTPADGDGSTVSVGGSSAPWSLAFSHGPTFRHVVDLADSLTSWIVIAPWNAATPDGHSPDLRERWAGHGYVPLRMDWTRIERDAAATLLFPAGARH